jgi:hypothetical protein
LRIQLGYNTTIGDLPMFTFLQLELLLLFFAQQLQAKINLDSRVKTAAYTFPSSLLHRPSFALPLSFRPAKIQ